jgi:diguanylate cyclase (GGDEF)-like protein
MLSEPIASLVSRVPPPWRSAMTRARSFFLTVRGRILVAFTVMSVITASLGGYAAYGIRDAGVLVDKTFDESLMSINYARAAATDFAQMRAAFARQWIATDEPMREKLGKDIDELNKTLTEDLNVASQRSQSPRAARAAAKVQDAVDAWMRIRGRLIDGTKLDVNWETLDQYSAKVDEQIDLLVNYTAGDGFIYRQLARASVSRDIKFNIAGTALAILLSALVAWALSRRIVGPLASASTIAERIAAGKLDVVVPSGGTDELGALLCSMGVMRNNIKAMMDREVAQRRSAQARLADALQSSQEGVIVVDANDWIVLANAKAVDYFGLPPELLKPGVMIEQLEPALRNCPDVREMLTRSDATLHATSETRLPDGRWLRISRSPTRDGGYIVFCSDISAPKGQEAKVRETNVLLDAALENMSQGLCLYDAEDRLQVVNSRFFEIFGLPRHRIRNGMTYREVLEVSASINHSGKTGEQLLNDQREKGHEKGSGAYMFELDNGRVISCFQSSTVDGRWVATYEDVTERRQAEAQIMHMARHDALTNLPNRVLFRDRMQQALDQGEHLAVLFLDLDRFKSVNDSLGHSVGDALLCAVTERLQRVVRGVDTVARLGGDEFAIVQMDARPTDATELAGKIIEALSETFDVLGHQVNIGTSVGIALAPADGREPDQLLRNADMALYRAKAEGRSTYCFFQPEMDAQMQERRRLELDLRKALVADQFELYYQPLINLATEQVIGFEALLRWNHPERGVVTPDKFIPVAEDIGLIGPLGDWVLKQACHDATRWPVKLSVAVNLSAAQFRNPMLALSVVSALAHSGLPATRLELEITETVLLQDDQSVLNALHDIRQLGVRICMDDFGTGYSSLSYLRSFPFDKIKIDRSFINELGKEESDCVAIIRAVTRLGASLGMTTTAEGVETQEQLDILKAEGCTQAQGYLFSPPRPVSEVPAMLRDLKPRVRAA